MDSDPNPNVVSNPNPGPSTAELRADRQSRREFALDLISELNRLPHEDTSGIVFPLFYEEPIPPPPEPKPLPVGTRTIGTDACPPDPQHRWPRIFPPQPEPSYGVVTHQGVYHLITPRSPNEERNLLVPNSSMVTTATSTAEIDIDTPVAPHEISVRVKCPTKPSIVLRHVQTGQPIRTFVNELARLTEIPVERLKILSGFPPKRIALDRSLTVESMGLKSQESIIVERGSPVHDASTGTGNCLVYACKSNCSKSKGCNRTRPVQREVPFFKDGSTNTTTPHEGIDGKGPIWTVATQVSENTITNETIPPETPEVPIEEPPYPTSWVQGSLSQDELLQSKGILLRKVVPSDNSCLFSSFRYAYDGLLGDPDGYLIPESTLYLREIVAARVDSDPERYTEAFLGRPNSEYGQWITNLSSWGGAIELSILAEFYDVEIAIANTQTMIISIFGEGQNYKRRIYLIYDGIHYDPLFMELYDTALIVTKFKPDDMDPYNQAVELAQEAHRSHQYTDTKRFLIRCDKCKARFEGSDDASKHATLTGHKKFSELTPTNRY